MHLLAGMPLGKAAVIICRKQMYRFASVKIFIRNSRSVFFIRCGISSNPIWHWCPVQSQWQKSECTLKKYLLEMNPVEKITGSFVNHERKRRKIHGRNYCLCLTLRCGYGDLALADYSYFTKLWCPHYLSWMQKSHVTGWTIGFEIHLTASQRMLSQSVLLQQMRTVLIAQILGTCHF